MGFSTSVAAPNMIFQIPITQSQVTNPIPIIRPLEEKKPETTPPYMVKEGDTLTSIAEAHKTTVERLWAKNSTLTDPNLIEPNKPLEIPQDDEKLEDRPLPVIVSHVEPKDSATPASYPRTSSGGNLYSVGYCTWYVKNQRPDLPNNLGDAYAWYTNAMRQGMSVGNSPAVGAVGVAINYGHVVIVTGVNGNMVTVSEMNYQGWNVVSSRTAPASEFRYIY